MGKKNAIHWSYWVPTLMIGLTMLPGGIMMLLHVEQNVDGITALGYPAYLCTILGVAKILGCVALFFGQDFPTLKEWAYAGFAFDLLGASASYYLRGGEPLLHVAAPLLLLALLMLSHREWRKGRI